ncbi:MULTISPECIES: branched-chain amino acid ABC transporter permease [unclassified Massilia]|uniref:branched-chain amino acid ABC transporter permease n=1 Tax=unclassified Massilia TaxID=2609279 RepID=UPI00178441DD|nr:MULTISPECIES: branched-chain amino acid ABC transporter permease [unclassified Massilia]MBD8529262.1 branched-chain amino acid ABC transporter permease [Massilia sp. CFBP 13647]MBD8672656.1 branched-chain amino acid ABC transporter permease [Massilia sp. CFBP 13721]
MDLTIFAILTQDGIASGAVYVLLALALVLVFSITRVIFIPLGEFLAFGALTMAALQAGKMPHSATLLLILGAAAFLQELAATMRSPMGQINRTRAVGMGIFKFIIFPMAVFLAAKSAEGAVDEKSWPMLAQLLLTFAIVAPMGPMIYRLAFQPLAESSVLVLLIVSVAVHLALLGVGLVLFGAEGSRTAAFSDAVFNVGTLTISGQSIVVIATALVLIGALYLYFDRTLSGKALRATAVHRRGARLVGIGTTQAGRLAYLLASTIGTLCGVLIAPLTTIYYDSGFLMGLKGFVGAIIGGLASYPLAAGGALLVGLLEAYSSFYASALKEVIVFTLIIPVLLWRSIVHPQVEEGDE